MESAARRVYVRACRDFVRAFRIVFAEPRQIARARSLEFFYDRIRNRPRLSFKKFLNVLKPLAFSL